MAALLVSISVMMLLMSVAMPVWRHQAQREKEAELIFRGQQYARAVNLYTRKAGPGNFPPSIDILVQQRFLRKKFKDPMTKDGEFEIITAASAQQGQNPQQQQPGGGRNNAPSTGLSQPRQTRPSPAAQQPGQGASPFAGGQAGGGIMGVRSKSKEASIRIYNGGTHYSEWNFVFANVSNRPGGRGAGRPGGPGGAGVPGMPGVGRPGGAGGGPGRNPGGGVPRGGPGGGRRNP